MEKYLKSLKISTNLKSPENKKIVFTWILVLICLGIVLSMAGYFMVKLYIIGLTNTLD
jgi:hypothetical protein